MVAMRRVATTLTVMGVFALTFTLVWTDNPLSSRLGKAVCNLRDGKWASVAGVCFTRACYAAGDCGDWAHPTARCSYLKPGDSTAEVYFQLGNGEKVAEDRYAWSRGKASSGEIDAIIEDGKLVSLDCS